MNTNKRFYQMPKVFVILLAVSLFSYLISGVNHQSLDEILPYLIFLFCPLLHLFVHGGNHSHRPQRNANASQSGNRNFNSGKIRSRFRA
ncbi:Protein of unknown function (DUF2933) [Alteromonadaceae bacterium 2753L.S.0a.02]|nr:Protein of unknown function (DUF2933) [Alteromonadaceae bacterium 2753L.S.0a.02]